MLDRVMVDVARTFVGLALLRVEPKLQRKDRNDPNSEQVPAHDKNGVPKWTVHLSVEIPSFDTTKYDNIEITVTSPNKPGEGIPENSKVTVEGLTLGMMPLGKGKAVTIFYAAEAIIPLKAAQFAQPVQQPRVAPAQPQQPAQAPQPVRVAPGQ